MAEREKIRFSVVEYGQTREIETFENEYRNLMVLLNDWIYLENFGECGGQGRCATCAVKVEGAIKQLADDRSRNEARTLEKNDYNVENLRLSCQILINHLLNGTTVYIEEAY